MFYKPGELDSAWVDDVGPRECVAAFGTGALGWAFGFPGGDLAGLVVGAFGADGGGRHHALGLLDVDEVGCGLGEGGLVVEVYWEVDAFVVVGVEDDGVWFYEGVAVVGVFVAEDEEVDAPAFGEVFELFVVVAAAPGHEVGGADSGFVVFFGEVAGEDGGVEAVHHAWAWEGVGAEDVALGAVGAEGDGHGKDEFFDGVTDGVCVG